MTQDLNLTTHDVLIELGVEELPARLAPDLAAFYAERLQQALVAERMTPQALTTYVTPRRLAWWIQGVPTAPPVQQQQRLGPSVEQALDRQGQPTPALLGFARSCGVAVEALERVATPKGTRMGCTVVTPSRPSLEVLTDRLPDVFVEPVGMKTMRWGEHPYAFVRPVRWCVARWGDEVIPVTLFGCKAQATTYGHRFHHPGAVTFATPEGYADALRAAYVEVCPERRRERIVQGCHDAVPGGTEPVLDPSLLKDVVHLSEWPVVLLGKVDERFLNLPDALLETVCRVHQKTFVVASSNTGALAPYFLAIAALESRDPSRVVAGNERVIRARLSDAHFFYAQDRATTLPVMAKGLQDVVFQAELGSMADKVGRLTQAATALNEQHAWVNPDLLSMLLPWCKADTCSETVGEFPELTGALGSALMTEAGGCPAEVLTALASCVQPRSATEATAADALGALVAVVDRMDNLVGRWGVGQRPSPDKDPYGLRRDAVGVVRTLVQQGWRVSGADLVDVALAAYGQRGWNDTALRTDLLNFLSDRCRHVLRERGYPHHALCAVEVAAGDRWGDWVPRLEAFDQVRDAPGMDALMVSHKRLDHLLKKQEEGLGAMEVNPDLFDTPEEVTLWTTYQVVVTACDAAFVHHAYQEALLALAPLAEPLGTFFDAVRVMVEDASVRSNRLVLLATVASVLGRVVDLSSMHEGM